MNPGITAVVPLENFELLVSFADGESRRFSMLPYMQYPAYQALNEPGKFNLAHVANGTVAADGMDREVTENMPASLWPLPAHRRPGLHLDTAAPVAVCTRQLQGESGKRVQQEARRWL